MKCELCENKEEKRFKVCEKTKTNYAKLIAEYCKILHTDIINQEISYQSDNNNNNNNNNNKSNENNQKQQTEMNTEINTDISNTEEKQETDEQEQKK